MQPKYSPEKQFSFVYWFRLTITFVILIPSAFFMNVTKFEGRYYIFPILLLLLPNLVEYKFNLFEFLRLSSRGLKLFFLLCAAVLLFFTPLYFAYFLWFKGYAFSIPDSDIVFETIGKGLILVVVVSLPEEVFFRAFIQETVLSSCKNKLFFIISKKNFITSLIFGLTHAIAFMDISRAATFFPSLLFGWIVEKSDGKIVYSILFHSFANILSFSLWNFVSK